MEITALLMGFLGSLHCVAMCSPLLAAVTNNSSKAFQKRLIYNAGRIFIYMIIGALFSSIGKLFDISSYQNILSILLAATLLILGLTGISYFKVPVLSTLLQKLAVFIKINFAALFSRKNSMSIFLLGSLNGLLPCGLSFVAFAYCITLKGAMDGAVFMLLFGIGTLPAMVGGASVLLSIAHQLKLNVKVVNSNLLVLSGLALLLRVFWFASLHAHQTGERVIDIVLCR
jgi:uncharacterized protein